MKIAIVISGLVRFPEQGFIFLKNILRQSPHDIDIFAGIWSIDSDKVPELISRQLKGLTIIPYSIRNDLYNMLKDNNLNFGKLSDDEFIRIHSGLICHMATCTAFKKELKDYDIIVKWRWDAVVMPIDFNRICNHPEKIDKEFISDLTYTVDGNVVMNEIVFLASATNMLSAYTPVNEKFLLLGTILDREILKSNETLLVSPFYSYTQLPMDIGCDISSEYFNWALIRENILDNLHCLHIGVSEMVKLQQRYDRSVNINKENKYKKVSRRA
jgi:hypothetical protein